MDIITQRILALGIVGAILAGIAVYADTRGKDGSGWAVLAFCFLFTSCQQQ